MKNVKFVCNGCGKCGNLETTGGMRGEVCGGYFSEALTDMTRYKFVLCENCLVKLFSGFTVPVTEKCMFEEMEEMRKANQN